MIKLIDRPVVPKEPIIGCRFYTIGRSYGGLEGMCRFFSSDGGGVLCQFGATLYLSGPCDYNDLRWLTEFYRISTVICLEKDASGLDGWGASSHSVMNYVSDNPVLPSGLELMPALQEAYDIIAEDSGFGLDGFKNYLPWLSDMTRRINCGTAFAAVYGKASAALVPHVGCAFAHISHLVTRRGCRGKGYAGRLVASLAETLKHKGLRAFVETQDDSLEAFYFKAGFERFDRLTVLTPLER